MSSPRFLAFAALAGSAAAVALVFQAGCGRKSSAPPVAAITSRLSFNEHIQPILSENCYQCHGPDKNARKADLRLDRDSDAFAPRKGGPAIVRGDPEHSALVKRLLSPDPTEIMPPPESHKLLKPEQIALLRQWIKEGAVYEDHWAFIPPKRAALPGVSRPGWTENPIDRFVLARLEKEGLAPSPEADRTTLIRRVTYDLTGLPPTPGEVASYLADTQPGAYEKVVDRLLASPRYGEHRTRYWLDYIRYADTHGIHFDNYRSIWPYRDYVIRAFNQDKPFDRFVREQLAGDMLPARNLDELAATGLVRCSMTTNEGGTVTEEVTVNLTRDRVEAFGATFLGLTTGCAACHDHKFDPLTQKEHYQLGAFLNNTADKPWDLNQAAPGPVLRIPADEARAEVDAALGERATLQVRLDQLRQAAPNDLKAWLDSGQRPQPVSDRALELRLRLDESTGDVVKNSAPRARPASFRADTNPLVWGESSWFWPSVRLDIFTRLPLGRVGDVEMNEAFSAGGWIMSRIKPGSSGTGDGSLFSRMGDPGKTGGRGWEIYREKDRYVVNLVDQVGTRYLSVVSSLRVLPGDWAHVFFTYDGSGRAEGLHLFINGWPVVCEVRGDSLRAGFTAWPKPGIPLALPGKTFLSDSRTLRSARLSRLLPSAGSIRTSATTHLGRRDDTEPLRESRYQDVRFYRRALAPDEVARLPFEDVAAEIVARQPAVTRWTADEAFVVIDRFFLGQHSAEANRISRAIAALDTKIDELTKDGVPTLITRERAQPAYADVLKRGDYYSRVERVSPATPHFLPPLPAGSQPDRLGLADWLLMPSQPLLGRVTVNRMWQEIFGRGLVESAGDFGIMGTPPSHPALLDWLAVEFRENGWDVKKLYRLLVTSATYRQSASANPSVLARDPANRLLARGPRFRMDGEMLRDSALFAAGLLVEKIGGPPAKPYQPQGIWEEIAMPESNTKKYMPDQGEGLYRRSLYTFWKRASPPPSFETFDAPSRETVCPRRSRSNTPLQALVTMNDPQWTEAARKLAERAVTAAPDTPARLGFLASVTLGRPLEPKETAALERSQVIFAKHYREHPADAQSLLAVGPAPVKPGLDPAELAEWTLVSSQFLNLDEFLTK